MMANERHKLTQEVSDLLESDDELPDFYEDTPFTPAYQNDSRFEPIQFKWLNEQLTQSHTSNYNELELQTGFNSARNIKVTKTTVISTGILKKRDIFFIKCVEEFVKDPDTLLWFIDYLKHKSVHRKNSYGCLIADISPDNYNYLTSSEPSQPTNARYKIITKPC